MAENKQAQIKDLDYPECVRKRRGMYIYSKEHQIFEIIDNAIDEAQAGFATAIAVAIMNGKVVVEDNGRGIPTSMYPNQEKFPGLTEAEVAYTVLHAGGKFGGDDSGYNGKTGGLNGVGASCSNALSEVLKLRSKSNGKKYEATFERGVITEHMHLIEEGVEGSGTEVEFTFDETIWNNAPLDFKKIEKRCRQLAYLNPGVLIYLYIDDMNGDKPIKIEEQFCYPDGLKAYMEKLTKNKTMICDIISTQANSPEVDIDIALSYSDDYADEIITFCNNINTDAGGDHLTGFKMGVSKAIMDYAEENKLIPNNFKITSKDIIEGIVAIVSVKVVEPSFEGQGKNKLDMPEVKTAVKAMTEEVVSDYLDKNPDQAKSIVNKCLLAAKAREAAAKARELTKKKKNLVDGGLPGKLAACSSNNPEECEIYLVEGDSAAGSAKQGRDRMSQAILPIFGKIFNVEKQHLDQILKSEKMLDAIRALKCGIGEDFDIDKIRYHRIIVMSDADVDGSHIQTLWITFFYRFMRPVIEKGYLYLACPPLYKLSKGKVDKYLYSDEELAAEDTQGAIIQRYKGLGEMNAEQLWETTMNPETRILQQITIEDAEAAEEMIKVCMGDLVPPRKEFIISNADNANLDI